MARFGYGSSILTSLNLCVLAPWREILPAPWRKVLSVLGMESPRRTRHASGLMKEPQLLMQRFDLSGESHDQPDTVEINATGRTEVLNSA